MKNLDNLYLNIENLPSPGRIEWLPTPVFLPGDFHGQMSLVAYSPWTRKELDTTEQLSLRQLCCK